MNKVDIVKKRRVVKIGKTSVQVRSLVILIVILAFVTMMLISYNTYKDELKEQQEKIENQQKKSEAASKSSLYNRLKSDYVDNRTASDFYKGMIGYHSIKEINNGASAMYVIATHKDYSKEFLIDTYNAKESDNEPKIGYGIQVVSLSDTEANKFASWCRNNDKEQGYISSYNDGDWTFYLVEATYNDGNVNVPFKTFMYEADMNNIYQKYTDFYGYPVEWLKNSGSKYVSDTSSKFWNQYNYNQRIILYNNEFKNLYASIKEDPNNLSSKDAESIVDAIQNYTIDSINIVRVIGENRFLIDETTEVDSKELQEYIKNQKLCPLDECVKFTKTLYRIYYSIVES